MAIKLRLHGRLLCWAFGHLWTNDALPTVDGNQRQHCGRCGKKRIINIFRNRNAKE